MSCNFCERKGIAILPVRSAITKDDAGAPELPQEFSVDIVARGKIKYTTRLLREGYLYVYDEKRSSWSEYLVTEDAYFWKISHDSPSIIPKLGQKPCASQPNEIARASFISLPLALNENDNGLFWFAWSNTKWTDYIKDKYEDAEFRKIAMQCFDLKRWLIEKTAYQTISFTKLHQVVAEYSHKKINKSFFDFYSCPWLIKTESDATFLLNAATGLTSSPFKADPSRAAIINLQDPTGISQDLSQLIIDSHENFLSVCRESPKLTDFDRKITTFSNIKLAEYNVKENNKLRMFLTAEEMEDKAYFGDGEIFILPSIAEKKAKKIRDDVNENYEQWSENEWKRYLLHANKVNLNQFKNDYDEQKKEYENNYEFPLFDMYLATLKHSSFRNYFIRNFDPHNKFSGECYTNTLGSCLIGSQLNKQCVDYIEMQLNGSLLDKENIFMRAFIYNQEEYAIFFEENIPKYTNNLNLSSLPWANLFTFYSEHLSKVADSPTFSFNSKSLNSVLISPILRILKKSSLAKTSRLTVLLAASEKGVIVNMTDKGTKTNLSKLLITAVMRETHNTDGMTAANKRNSYKIYKSALEAQVREKGISDAVLKELRIKQSSGVNGDVQVELKSNVLLKESSSPHFKGKSPKEIEKIAQDVASNITTTKDANNFYLKRSLSNIASGASLVSILFQLAAISSMIDQEKSWWGGLETSSEQRLSASWIGVTGSTLELATSQNILKFMNGKWSEVRWLKVCNKLFKGVGIIGIAILAYVDFTDSSIEKQKGNIVLSRLYFHSGILGVILICCIIARVPILGLFVAISLVIITIFIENEKPDDLMLWINKTMYFGKNNEGLFALAKDEEDAFAKLWGTEA
ncbi:T6SS effector BTH_I2691 family protein [Providencia stuartii]|uniref:T6SS effector BTH_I2691 family protein n=1 Tax=Providencia stuartii TaxID=588 RepID=UPI0033175C72